MEYDKEVLHITCFFSCTPGLKKMTVVTCCHAHTMLCLHIFTASAAKNPKPQFQADRRQDNTFVSVHEICIIICTYAFYWIQLFCRTQCIYILVQYSERRYVLNPAWDEQRGLGYSVSQNIRKSMKSSEKKNNKKLWQVADVSVGVVPSVLWSCSKPTHRPPGAVSQKGLPSLELQMF